jgi:hypothetical protein
MTAKEEFISIYKENIKREGADKLLEFLERSDFFTAPSSTRFHGSYEGGLVQHSLNVYHCLKDYLSRPRTKELYGMDYSEETIALVALLHDICKVNFYTVEMRNKKNDETGQWEKVPFYAINDTPLSDMGRSPYTYSRVISAVRTVLPVRKHSQYATTWAFHTAVPRKEVPSERRWKCIRSRWH